MDHNCLCHHNYGNPKKQGLEEVILKLTQYQ